MLELDTSKYGYYHYGRVVSDRDAGVALIGHLTERLRQWNDTGIHIASFETAPESGKPHVHAVVRMLRCPKQKSITPLRRLITGDEVLWSEMRSEGFHLTEPKSSEHLENTIIYVVKDGDVLWNNTGVPLEELQAARKTKARKERSGSKNSDLFRQILKELCSGFAVELSCDERGYFVTGDLIPYDLRHVVKKSVSAIDKVYAAAKRRLPNEFHLEALVASCEQVLYPSHSLDRRYSRLMSRLTK